MLEHRQKQAVDVLIVGGGAAAWFAAIQLLEKCPFLSVMILEKDTIPLKKVKISGGGRCNVTHACFEASRLVQYYPRGQQELLEPFGRFSPADMVAWLKRNGVATKTEPDGRIFPRSDSSQSIIDCFLEKAKQLGVLFQNQENASNIYYENNKWIVESDKCIYTSMFLVMATGSSPKMWDILQKLGHTVVSPVPSLFTFNIKDTRLEGLMGLSFSDIKISIPQLGRIERGALLITHWGLSGPAVLKISAWEAIALHKLSYQCKVTINWLGERSAREVLVHFLKIKEIYPKRKVLTDNQFDLPKRLWEKLAMAAGFSKENWAEAGKKTLEALAKELCEGVFEVKGKSTFKDEFVTAGGIDLQEVDFETFASKKLPNLYFAGEVLNIDALTGGFNFQAAWTGAWHVAQSIASKNK